MNRFNDDEDEDFRIPDSIENDDDDDGENIIYIEEDVELYKLNQKLLFKVINTLEKSWFWKFFSEEKKRDKIMDLYFSLKAILDESEL